MSSCMSDILTIGMRLLYAPISVQCTAICIPAIMAKYARLSARHTYERATGMPVCQERRVCKVPRRPLGYPHDGHICRGAPGMSGIQEASMGLLG